MYLAQLVLLPDVRALVSPAVSASTGTILDAPCAGGYERLVRVVLGW